MPENVVSQSGKSVQVATLSDVTQDVGDIAAATITKLGAVLQGIPVADVETYTVTDIATAATAIAAIGTTLSELQQSLRNAGVLATSD